MRDRPLQIALMLSTAFVSTTPDYPDRERKIRQYVDGLDQIAEVSAQYSVFDVYSVDNTVEDPARLESRVADALRRIPGFRGSVHFSDNELGKHNHGSGTMVQWTRIVPQLVDRYEYVVHYEPRQHLESFSFFERMANRPDSYVCMYRDKWKLYGIPLTVPMLWTGFFSMRTRDLLDYTQAKDRAVLPTVQPHPWWWVYYRRLRWKYLPEWAVWLDESIEFDLPRWVRRHRIPIARVADLGSVWHQEGRNRMLKMMECDFRDDEIVA
jgi:hypothetical protein